MALDPERRRQLHALKLRALVGEHLDWALGEVRGTDDGAVAVATGPDDRPVVAALAEERPVRGLGGALAAALRAEAGAVHVFANGAAGLLARRATFFDPAPTVWELRGRKAVPAVAEPVPAVVEAPVVPELVALLELGGVDVVVEHGVVIGEVQGLEVARVVGDGHGFHVEVGVGAHDREAFGLLHGDEPTPDAIRRVVELVGTHRAPGADPHPLNRLGAERWLRARLIERPEVVGAASLSAAPPPVARQNLKQPVPAVATGVDVDGGSMVVVTSVGIDLDLVPFAADARESVDADAELVVAVPARDAHSVLHAMADALTRPARVVAVDDRWREWSSATSVA
jgi:hypothetical protein